MKMSVCASLLGAGVLHVASVSPAYAGEVWQDYSKLISERTAVGTLGPALMGDQVSYYSGVLSFNHTDVSIPGNNGLPVEIRRSYSVRARNGYPFPDTTSGKDLPFGDWSLDLPHVTGVFAESLGWVGDGTARDFRCSRPSLPPGISFAYNYFKPDEYFNGLQLSLGGAGGGELLGVASGVPIPTSGGPYVWITQDRTVVSCLQSVANAAGEGFLATTSDGTRYWFNWMASFAESSVRKPRENQEFRSIGTGATGHDVVVRRKYALYATRAEDRFGNWVTYRYENAANAPVRLAEISSSDGRSITLLYNAAGQVSHVNAPGQSWTYMYDGTSLSGVQLPDGSAWTIAFRPFTSARIDYEQGQPGDPLRNCMDPGGVVSLPVTGTIKHPSGALGEFTVSVERFGRSNVLAMCKHVWKPDNDPNDDAAIYPIAWDSYALTRKRITGPGLSPLEWNYSYGSIISWFYGPGGDANYPICTSGDCISPQCVSDACAGTTVAEVQGPDGFIRYTFGNSYRYNEGKLLKTEIGSVGDGILRVENVTYQWPASGLPYAAQIGYPLHNRVDSAYSEAYLRPEKSKTIEQQGASFNRTVEGFDSLARPVQIRSTGVLAP